MIGIPWAVIISLLVLGLAYFIKHFLGEMFEEPNEFLTIIGIFILIYISAAIAVTWLNPQISQTAAYLASNG